jgi:hypothetical protein
LLQLFAEHNAQCKALVGKGFAPKTVMRFESTYRYVLEFMQGKYHISDIALNELAPAFVYDGVLSRCGMFSYFSASQVWLSAM